MNENPSRHEIFKLANPWDNNGNPIWLASTISLMRNVEKFKFPGKLSSDRKKQIIALISKELLEMEEFSSPYAAKGEELTHIEKEFLSEHFLTSLNFNQAHTGEGFILDQSGEFIATLNLQDHLHLQLIDCKGELETSWGRLVKIESLLGKHLKYSFQPKFGFLTAHPAHCGTALLVTAYLHVPGLIHSGKIDDILEKLDDEALRITGMQGSPTDIIGDLLMVQNAYTLGITEENIISSLRNFITKILVEEQIARKTIKQTDNTEIKDKVSRAFGILIHSYQIEAVEALNAVSLLKLGLESIWIEGIDNKQINNLFFNCRRAHLLNHIDEKTKINQEDIPHKRAEYIHQSLKNVHLTV